MDWWRRLLGLFENRNFLKLNNGSVILLDSGIMRFRHHVFVSNYNRILLYKIKKSKQCFFAGFMSISGK